MFELADYNKLILTKCRRADDTLYNIIKFDNIPNVKSSDFVETNEYKNYNHIFTLIKNEWKSTLFKWKNCIKKKDYHGLKLDGLIMMIVHKL